MPYYTLYYFNGRGRAEICRMLLAAAGVQYTDRRIEFQDWDRYRNDMPGYCLPVLEIDKKHRVPETMAIARFLAREYDFYGRTTMDMFRNDYICDCLYDVMHAYMRYFHAKNGRFMSGFNLGMSSGPIHRQQMESMKANNCNHLQQIYIMELLRVLPFLDRILSKRSGGKGFFLGDQLMLCDMMCYCFFEGPYMENTSLFERFPMIIGLRKKVSAHPKITSYLSSRCSSLW